MRQEFECPELTALANEILASSHPPDPVSDDLERFERESDPEVLAPLAIDLGPRLVDGAEKRMREIARSGDAVHREHALLALMGHFGAVETMLALADPAQPPNVADRALDALLSVADRLDGAQRDEARTRARLLADQGEASPRSTALLLLAELGAEAADRGRLEALALHEDPRVSLAARRTLIEFLRAQGQPDRARRIWETLPKEQDP